MARPVTPLLTTVSLAVLADGPLHAYVMKKRMEMGLGKMVPVSDGSLYPLLRSLEDQGSIISHIQPAEHGRPDRVVYEITEAGRRELVARLAEPLQAGPVGQADFYVRVACFHHLSSEAREALIGERRARLMQDIEALLAARDGVSRFPGHLELADLRERQLRTELEWLEALEHQKRQTKEDDS